MDREKPGTGKPMIVSARVEALRAAQAIMARHAPHYAGPTATRLISEELIADRRQEARAEEEPPSGPKITDAA
jgi:hypothetical protein